MSSIEIDKNLLKSIYTLIKTQCYDEAAEIIESLMIEDVGIPTEINVASCLFKKGNKYLVARRKPHLYQGGYWEFPGATVRDGESYRNAIKRRIKEELSVDVKTHQMLAQATIPQGSTIVKVRLFKCSVDSGKFDLSAHDAMQWATIPEIEKLMISKADKLLCKQLRTFEYYEKEGISYIAETMLIKIATEIEALELVVPPKGKILDIGCGSGRDTKYFLSKGFAVTSMDASSVMSKLSSKEIDHPVQTKNILDLNKRNEFDGIWASSSLPHLPKSEIGDGFNSLISALKKGGILYASFKKGDGEGIDDKGRYLSRYQISEIEDLIKKTKKGNLIHIWESDAARQDSTERWINILVSK